MKKVILTLAFMFAGLTSFAQSEEENLNKWIDTYSNLNANKNWQEMISSFNQCMSEVPNWNFAYYYKGIAEYQTNNYAGAVSDLTQFINSNPEDKEALQQAYLFRAFSYNKQGLYNQAIKDADVLLQFSPQNKEAL